MPFTDAIPSSPQSTSPLFGKAIFVTTPVYSTPFFIFSPFKTTPHTAAPSIRQSASPPCGDGCRQPGGILLFPRGKPLAELYEKRKANVRGAKPRRGTDRSSADPARYTGRKTPGERVPPPPIAEPFAHLRLRASHPRTYRNPAIRTKIRKIRGNPARGRVFRRSPPEFRC